MHFGKEFVKTCPMHCGAIAQCGSNTPFKKTHKKTVLKLGNVLIKLSTDWTFARAQLEYFCSFVSNAIGAHLKTVLKLESALESLALIEA